MNSGDMRYLIRFERRTPDANGEPLGAWAPVMTQKAKLVWLRGSEPVVAQRLQGVQPANLSIRASALARQIGNAWRCVDARIVDPKTADYFAIKTATLSADRKQVDMLVELGADG